MAKGRYVGKGALLGYGAKVQVHSVTSTATVLPNWGMVSFGSSAAKTWRMKNAEPGQSVTLYCNDAAGGALQTVKTSSTNSFISPAGTRTSLIFSGDNQTITLMGRTTSIFEVVASARDGVTTVTSTAVKFPTEGVVSFGATAAKSWRMPPPMAGQRLTLYCNDGATGAIQKVFASTSNATNFATTGGLKNVAQFDHDHESLVCHALSSAVWAISPNASIAYSTA
jgi:hypothetical protein